MPTYTYRCTHCNHTFDAFQSMKADPLTECPQCKGPLERLIGAGAGIVFKGSGFYVTDYRKPDAKAAKAQPAQSPAPESKESIKESSPAKEPAPATPAPTASSPANSASSTTTTS